MSDLALMAAVEAAKTVAIETAESPTEAAMQVVCAYLIAVAQLEGSKANEPSDAVDEMLLSAGFKPVEYETVRVMRSFGLSPILQFRKSKSRADSAQLGWFRRWFQKMTGA